MIDWPTTKCRSCEAPIVWARHAGTGRRVPVDAEPTTDGNVELHNAAAGTDGPPVVECNVHHQPPLDAGPLRLSHFVTCPQAAAWKDKTRGQR